MALTYLDLTNIALREINEVPMSEQQFLNARGLQQFAKQAVNRSYLDIVNSSREWPWFREQSMSPASSVVVNVAVDQQSFDLPASYNQVSWDSMYITDKDLLVNDPLVEREVSQNLEQIEYEEWVRKYREDDLIRLDKGSTDTKTPRYVFMYPDKNTIGISPVPSKQYSVQFDAWKVPIFLDLPSDTLPFPDEHYNTIISRARYYLWLFRENDRQASFAKNDYQQCLMNMKELLLAKQLTRIKAV